MRRLLVASATSVAALVLAGVAYADSCSNQSRPPAACGWSCPGPVVDGNWVWLPSIGHSEYAWGFSPPGSITSQTDGLPDANGNYVNQSGNPSWLLENSAICNGGVPNRQTSNGIQSGCGN